MDSRGTSFSFHQISAIEMEILPAGPERKVWTHDDLVIKSSGTKLAEPKRRQRSMMPEAGGPLTLEAYFAVKAWRCDRIALDDWSPRYRGIESSRQYLPHSSRPPANSRRATR